ncbi:MAG: phosphoadenylyl-sulfate reductase [Bacteroidales bacterium]|nr:phosphoadenylyl-sulfate reductase [Bacteroidales bacterium]
MTIEDIKTKIEIYKHQQLKIFATSSFQTQSIVLLHIISIIDNTIPIFFIDTGYHFPETLEYKDLIKEKFKLNVIDIKPIIPKSLQRDSEGRLFYTSDAEYCCFLNKVKPLEAVLMSYDVWINGIRRQQTEERSVMNYEEIAPYNVIRFHPLLDWSDKMVYEYIRKHNLPVHPLEEKGYLSIGCEPCTQPAINGLLRSGRWKGLNKKECGLHTNLIIK